LNGGRATDDLTIDDLRAGFFNPPSEAAPLLRWWWFGPSVTRAELDRELIAMAEAGLGGVEVAYVYPLAPATTEFGSDKFLGDLRFAAERAHELGLRFDLTLGSGWSFGGRISLRSLPLGSCTGNDARLGRDRWRFPWSHRGQAMT
jgi:hypothetical protein